MIDQLAFVSQAHTHIPTSIDRFSIADDDENDRLMKVKVVRKGMNEAEVKKKIKMVGTQSTQKIKVDSCQGWM